MAKNMVHEEGTQIVVVQASRVSGDPMVVGQIPGVALTSSESGTNNVTMKTDGVFLLSVKGENNAGNSAVAIGDILYYEAGQTPPVNKDNVAGVRFGYAMDAITSGSTATIRVKVGY